MEKVKNMNNKPLGQLSNDDYCELLTYRCLGTIRQFYMFRRKRLPMKVVDVYVDNDNDIIYKCPACMDFTFYEGMSYCPECGQRLVIPDNLLIGG